MKCDWCEEELTDADRPIRLSTTEPPARARDVISAVANGFAAAIRAAQGEEEVTLWFHRECWHTFYRVLRGPLL